MRLPSPIFLDTNVYIIGTVDSTSPERKILEYLGFDSKEKKEDSIVLISDELIEQILRVSKRIKNKDLGGEILGRIWQCLNVYYVFLNYQELFALENLGSIPREDVGVYLTARTGGASCFVSANHKLIKALVDITGEFECLTPDEFFKKYLSDTEYD
jgi:predicted nucleic acid-binding protein